MSNESPRMQVCRIYWHRPEPKRCVGCPIMGICQEPPAVPMTQAWLDAHRERMDNAALVVLVEAQP